ncbi:MAG TPA: hypothetical protein VK020_13325, partial [Microlunatus sp.]|nr:hypothetical protein [Microlunatus sp.]
MTDHDQDQRAEDAAAAGLDRRSFIGIGGAAALGIGAGGIGGGAVSGSAQAAPKPDRGLRFDQDGRFTIVQFNDTQDDEHVDRRTIELMEATLDSVRPDLVIMNGDNISGGCEDARAMKQAMNNVVLPMERRSIP